MKAKEFFDRYEQILNKIPNESKQKKAGLDMIQKARENKDILEKEFSEQKEGQILNLFDRLEKQIKEGCLI